MIPPLTHLIPHPPTLANVSSAYFAARFVMFETMFWIYTVYLVAPRIMQRTVSVPGAVTIVAALIGGTLLGMLGALLAIPAAAGLLLLYDEVLVPRQRRV